MAAAEAAASSAPAPERRLLEVEEDEVVIDFKPNAKCRADLRLRSLHPSLHVAFKVQTSSPLKFLVSPPRGAVPPLSTASLRVVLRPQAHPPPSFPRSRADRFLVLSSLSAARLDSAVGSNADTSAVDARGRTPLDVAREKGYQEVVDVLERWELVMTAARRGDLGSLESLLSKRAAIRGRDQYGLTALHLAAIKGHCDAIALLAGSGCMDVECEDVEGHRPLHLAVEGGHAEAVEVLLDMGADVNARTRRGATPLQMAEAMGYEAVAQLLCARGAEVAAAPALCVASSSSSSISCA